MKLSEREIRRFESQGKRMGSGAKLPILMVRNPYAFLTFASSVGIMFLSLAETGSGTLERSGWILAVVKLLLLVITVWCSMRIQLAMGAGMRGLIRTSIATGIPPQSLPPSLDGRIKVATQEVVARFGNELKDPFLSLWARSRFGTALGRLLSLVVLLGLTLVPPHVSSGAIVNWMIGGACILVVVIIAVRLVAQKTLHGIALNVKDVLRLSSEPSNSAFGSPGDYAAWCAGAGLPTYPFGMSPGALVVPGP
jgi:hypothetical protein